jgi:transcriptional regulator with XRE-family HTH domain
MKFQNQFGSAFKKVRRARGLTQEDFAHESGRTYISELERGLKQPTLQKIDALAVPLFVHPIIPIFMAYLDRHDEPSSEKLLELIRNQMHDIFLHSNDS